MAKRSSEIQAKYDATHCKHYSLKFNVINDEEVVEKLASVPSIQGYVKSLVIKDLNSAPKRLSDFVPISNAAEDILMKEAEKIGKSVPDLVALIIDSWIINKQ